MIAKISVIMGVFNQRGVIQKVIEAYRDQTLSMSDFELIVVDSGSTDGSIEWLQSATMPFAMHVKVVENRGKAAARNHAAQLVQSPLLVITDADMIPHPDFLKAHWMAHASSHQPTCFEGLTYNMDHLHWPPQPDYIEPYITRHLTAREALGWYYFLTGNVSMPVTLFHDMGGFDEQFTGYGWEDLELGYRLSQRTVPLLYLPGAINYHYHVVTHDDAHLRNIAKGESARLFLAKHPQLKWFLGLNPVSRLVYRWLSPPGRCLSWLTQHRAVPGWQGQFASWVLGEYHYLSGILGDTTTQTMLRNMAPPASS